MSGSLRSLVSFVSKMSLPKKIILIYIIVIFLPGCLLLYVYYQKSSALIERNLGESMLQTLKQAEINIDHRLTNIETISNTLISNPDLYRYLANTDKPEAVQYQNYRELERFIAANEVNQDIYGIRFFVRPELYYARENIHFFPLTDLQDGVGWYGDVIRANGKIHWISTRWERFVGKENAFVFSTARILRHPDHFDTTVGIVVIDVKPELLVSILGQVVLSPEQTIYIIDAGGNIVAHPDAGLLGRPSTLNAEALSIMNGQASGSILGQRNSRQTYTLFQKLSTNGWIIVAEIPKDAVSGQSAALTRISIVIVMAVSVIGLLFVLAMGTAYVVNRMGRRIRDMNRLIKRHGLRQLDQRMPAQEGSLRHLEQGISALIQTVQDLAEESYRARLQEREAQLKALQAQINPHFLYNTLDSLNWMAIRRNADEMIEMIESLSKYFRLSLSKGKDLVTLDEELELVKSYLYIQNVRFSGGIAVEFDIDPEARACMIPKLILQPVVENAVIHGIQRKKPKKGTIRVSARMDPEGLRLTVEDDGVGMEETESVRLLQPPSEGKEGGYGLYNVQERIRLYSQSSRFGVKVRSEPGEGTTVEMFVKVRD
jgi:two-component system sensor histidine kinase YesM